MGAHCFFTAHNGSGSGQRIFQEGDSRFAVNLPDGKMLEMVKIKAGTFMMGSPEGELGRKHDEQQHRVTLTKDYWLGKYEVTQGQWQAIMGGNPSQFKNGDNYPVEKVSWYDAKKFCDKLNELYTGKMPQGYRFDLPTEAQWEYACRAGTTTALYNNRNLTTENGYCRNLAELGWYSSNSDIRTHPVGQKQPNAWGLYDMYGNVWEWCNDWYGPYNSNGVVIDPTGPAQGSAKIRRGGGFCNGAYHNRSAKRMTTNPELKYSYRGFRLALVYK